MHNRTIAFGPFRFYPEPGQLFDGERQVHLGHRAIKILTLLVERAGDIVKHDELVSNVWPETVVEDNNLRVQMSALRKALREGSRNAEYIYNVPGRGYQFSADDIRLLSANGQSESPPELPASLNVLFGRDEAVKTIGEEIASRRLVTIVGSGGIGKTSLAIAIGKQIAGGFRGGTCFLDLGLLKQPSEILCALANAIGASQENAPQLNDFMAFLCEKELLIIIDNCEHLIDDVSVLTETLLEGAPKIRILATSREPLRARGEWVHRLAPLQCPPLDEMQISIEDALAFPATRLFVERAQATLDSFQFTDADGSALSWICNKLDGIPFTIELAAARIDGFGLHGLIAQLESSFSVLTRGRRGAVPRQRTLKASLDWSYELLSAGEQTLLQRLSVFTISFTHEAAIAVISGENLSASEVAVGIADLVAKSLISMSLSGGQTSYCLLRTTRSYALEKLAASPSADAVRIRHATYVSQIVKKLESRWGAVRYESQCTNRSLIDELRSALAWCFSTLEHNRLGWEILVASSHIWFHLSLLNEYVSLVRTALNDLEKAARPNGVLKMRLLVAVAPALYHLHGPSAEIRDSLERGLALAKTNHDKKTQLFALRGLWAYHLGLSEYEQSLACAEEYGRSATTQTDSPFMFPTLKGTTFLFKGQIRRARKYLEYASSQSDPHISPRRGSYDYDHQVVQSTMLARIYWLEGRFKKAVEMAEASLQEAVESQRTISMIFALAQAVCPVYMWSGNFDLVDQRLSELERLCITVEFHYWYQYVQVFRTSLGQRSKVSPAGRLATSDLRSGPWGPRQIEESSVLPNGFVSSALVTRAQSNDPIWCSAENLRSAAMRHYDETGVAGLGRTLDLLNKSLNIARCQGTLAWELRTSTSLASILRQQNKRFEAKDLIERVLDRLSNEQNIGDFAQAHLLFESLS
ncbi:hypothetical protein GNZ12_04170 [Paraburkholderia sp. 1N]|uniref:OmpR/PhoB-type domain-containing protein n=1 Tax=Paraburkholderia solitsugae TaxID=2675748 RepID=A0ABX2BK71_9BURK|nr:winged helix-turn-helix domain-containing protein [Paraburkholderia solitsugae]NPT40518.1 hypothetical protein [Paraburkholderia solitsugae]